MPGGARTGATAANDRATVHVIDDDVSPREALSLLFPSVGLEVRTYASVKEFLDAGLYDGPGCIVLDVRLPGISGLDFQSHREELGIHLPIVLMTGHGDVPMSVRAMKAGAVDFLLKPFGDQDMIDAATAALERDRQRRVAEHAAAAVRHRYASLSPREKQVMARVTDGKMNKQVAFDLGLSDATVKLYRSAVMRKMAARTFADLVRMTGALRLHDTGNLPPRGSPAATVHNDLLRFRAPVSCPRHPRCCSSGKSGTTAPSRSR